jgi:aspartyl-tRNA(Asn)/glutamyl-tRNA(Gln) amidotransferase subunit C
MDESTLADLAALARLRLPESARKHLVGQIETLLHHFAMLQDVSTDGVEASAYPTRIPHRLRPDRAEPPLPPEEVLANAPARRGGCFLVPRVIEG